jgi:hypothetical protein
MPESTTTIADIPKETNLEKIKGLFGGYNYFSFLIVPFVFTVLFFYLYSSEIAINKGSRCVIAKNELCDSEYTVIEGVINDPTLYEGLGYLFEPEDRSIRNPIYIRNIVYTGADLLTDGSKSSFDGKIRFGEKIKVRGLSLIYDYFRCDEAPYYKENKENCSKDTYRVIISPTLVRYIPEKNQKIVEFGTLGRITDLHDFTIDCEKTRSIEFCDVSGEDECLDLELNSKKKICSNINTIPESFYLTVLEDKEKKYQTITGFYQISGVNYTSKQVAD